VGRDSLISFLSPGTLPTNPPLVFRRNSDLFDHSNRRSILKCEAELFFEAMNAVSPFYLPNPFFRVRLTPNVVQSVSLGDVFESLDRADESCILRFENEFARLVGSKGALAMNSGRSALAKVVSLIGVRRGDEVIMPSLACPAVADAVVTAGAIPVLCDVDRFEGTIDVGKLERCISAKTRAIVAIHYQGLPCDLPKIKEIANRHHLSLVEDCAQALGSKIREEPMGSFGDFAIYSFGTDKPITTGTGGMITTPRSDLADLLERERSHIPEANRTVERSAARALVEMQLGHNKNTYGTAVLLRLPIVFAVGLLGRRPEAISPTTISKFSARIGLCQMNSIRHVLAGRAVRARQLHDIIKDCAELYCPALDGVKSPAFLRYTVVAKSLRARDQLMRNMKRNGIEAGPINWRVPLHRLGYGRASSHQRTDFDGTEYFCDRFVNLPCHPSLDQRDMDQIRISLRRTFDN
jgi:dTDP-4-amino-4,6-dideoxygalactose transaminase